MTAASDDRTPALTHAALYALERLAQQRYGRDAPALNWSIAQELVSAGFVTMQGRGAVSITCAGRDFLRARTDR
jgi:hypothetical protein